MIKIIFIYENQTHCVGIHDCMAAWALNTWHVHAVTLHNVNGHYLKYLSSYSKVLYARNCSAFRCIYYSKKSFLLLLRWKRLVTESKDSWLGIRLGFPTISKMAVTYCYHFILCALSTDNFKLKILTNSKKLWRCLHPAVSKILLKF